MKQSPKPPKKPETVREAIARLARTSPWISKEESELPSGTGFATTGVSTKPETAREAYERIARTSPWFSKEESKLPSGAGIILTGISTKTEKKPPDKD